ncbi:hypothetical protein [Paraburkholderia strydomiana]|uniref:hypothetical protein n=1 Tax=Paraburkholderia strydomiana TaxID=1245417 RepID=UPI0038BD00ED
MCNVAVAAFFPDGLRVSLCLRRWLRVLGTFVGMSILAPGTAHADDWGCQVILCLSSPGGPEQYGECVPPIEKLWAALRHGDPFPTCDFGSGGSQGTSASNTFASAAYCREDLLYWGGPEQSELLCNARGAINVEINGALYTRVWWDARGTDRTITEFYGAGSTATPYDPTQSVRIFLERESENSGGQGGGQ